MSNILDTLSMKKLGHLFRSAARTEILRALYYQPDAVGLRHLAHIADVHVHSAELTLDDLVQERLVTRRRHLNRVLYALKRNHPAVPVLTAVFNAAAQASIDMNRHSLSRTAKRILPFMQQASRMISHAKGHCYDA